MLKSSADVAAVGIDAVAVKPAECEVSRALDLPLDTIAIDYEGREHLPDSETVTRLAEECTLYVTTPVRADGFDPLGDDELLDRLPEEANRVLVAGHPAYLTEAELGRSIAPRLGAAMETVSDPWVGTEGVERLALAAGGTQYELLSRSTDRELRGLRAAGFEGSIAMYAPTVVTDDEDTVLDAVGDYVARRKPVASALPDDASTDADATDRAREILLAATRDYALVGAPEEVRERVETLKATGADTIVGYPARGLDAFIA
jgi:hypothetical protein